MSRTLLLYIPATLFVAVCILLAFWNEPVLYAKTLISGNELKGYFAFVLVLVSATVFMPLTVMPIIPAASAIFGPLATAVLSIIGWTLGAIGAFLVARYFGRPIISRFADLSKVDQVIIELPVHTRFLSLILLRMALPVDIVSYALGLTRSVNLGEYTLATIIGVSWFSFAFAYLGEALMTGNLLLLITLGALSLLIFTLAWFYLRRRVPK